MALARPDNVLNIGQDNLFRGTDKCSVTARSVVQLNKCETDPHFFQNFQCMTMFISTFCKICELNAEHEIVLF